MIYLINNCADEYAKFIRDDPVRPELPIEFRFNKNKFVAALIDQGKPESMVCISMHNFIPSSVLDLYQDTDLFDTAVFYTIWSYKSGSGSLLLKNIIDVIKSKYPNVTNFVTLSPKTETAKQFHLKNGAILLRENDETINYQYKNI